MQTRKGIKGTNAYILSGHRWNVFHAVLAVVFSSLCGDFAAANGTWTVTTQGAWLEGTGSNIDALHSPGSIFVIKNYDDQFDAGPLQSFWLFEAPNGRYDFSARSGFIRLLTNSGGADWFGESYSAPKLIQAVDGNFSISAYAETNCLLPDYVGGQLFVRYDVRNFFVCGILKTYNGIYRYISMKNIDGVPSMVWDVGGSNTGTFKMERSGNTISAFYLSSTMWVGLGSVVTDWKWIAAGVYAKDTVYSDAYADFSWVHFSTTRTYAATGYYESQIFDLTAVPFSQGTISWGSDEPIGASIEVRTRTSNDRVSWSTWSNSYPSSGSQITSPLAKYIQFSAKLFENLSLESPRLNNVTVSYPGIPPKAPIVSSAEFASNQWGNSAVLDLSWANPADNPVPISAFGYSLDGNLISGTKFDSGAVVVSSTITGTSFGELSDGRHTIRVAAQGEPVEFMLSPTVEFVVLKDTVAPQGTAITSSTHPAAEEVDNNNPVFNLSSADTVSATTLISGIEGWYYVLDRDSYTQPNFGDPFTVESRIALKGLENGTWWFHARVRDRAGNLGTVGHYPVRINFKGAILDENRVHAVPHPIRSDEATIRYDLAAPAKEVTMKFLDSSGNAINSLKGDAFPGVNQIAWNTRDLPNGVYFLRICVLTMDSKKLTIVKKLAILR